MSFRAFSTALWYISAMFIFGVAVEVAFFKDTLLGNLVTRPNFIENLPPILILVLFVWVLFELGSKRRKVQHEHSAVVTFKTIMSLADLNQYTPKIFDLKEPRATRRANLIVECSRRDPSSLHDAIPAAAALDASKLAARYTPLYVYAWILPVLGFIGTATGMASAIGGFSNALRGGQGQIEALANELGQRVIPGLSGAFGTTILALGAAVVAYLCTSALRARDQEALDELDRYCIVLLSRIPQPEGPEGKKIVAALDQILEQLRGILQMPISLEGAASAMKSASETLTMASRESASAALSISRAVSDLVSASSASNAEAAGTIASLTRQAVSAAQAIKEAAEALKSKKDEATPEKKATGTLAAEELIAAIRDLQKAVAAPIHVTLSREAS
jgi:biopolymer transport protein ExbB/TolQ